MGNIVFKDKLEQLVHALGTTKGALAQKMGISKSAMSAYFVSDAIPSVTALLKLLDAFPNLSAEWLFRDNGTMFLDETTEHEPKPQAKATPILSHPDVVDINPAALPDKGTSQIGEDSLKSQIYEKEYCWLKERFTALSDNYSKLQSAYIKAVSG